MLWHTLATIHGFNEMARMATSLGEKVFCRLARNEAEDVYKKLGGQIDRSSLPVVLTLPCHQPTVELTASDVGLMRKYIADLDAKRLAEGRTDASPDGEFRCLRCRYFPSEGHSMQCLGYQEAETALLAQRDKALAAVARYEGEIATLSDALAASREAYGAMERTLRTRPYCWRCGAEPTTFASADKEDGIP